MSKKFTSIELCAGAGGQALGIELAGFEHLALVEADPHCCSTLRDNRRNWKKRVHPKKLAEFDASEFLGVDLVAAGLPCPPFSKAGKQLGELDERNLFPDALAIIRQCKPKAVMIENVRGIMDPIFKDFRENFRTALRAEGYEGDFHPFNASDFGVPQLRPRVVFVALQERVWPHFDWPQPRKRKPPTVGKKLYRLIAADGWSGAEAWSRAANSIAPTIVGGSKKHGGPDLGPTRAKQAWKELHVNGRILANAPPPKDFVGLPALTVPMVALLQGFPPKWEFSGKKTNAYRQVGNAFPPPVAKAIALEIKRALEIGKRRGLFEEVA